MLSGQPAGIPDWVRELARGEDAGFFPADGAVWTVHRDVATLVAGPRALLLQALHPGAMAGVHDWSRYREDPFGRLNGTIRWITTVTFGSTAQARGVSDYVGRLHERVRGTYPGPDGQAVPYAAGEPDLLSWVHLAFTDSFLRTHQLFGSRPIPGGPDAYVRDWAIAGELMGVPDPPRSVAELEAQLDAVWASGILRADERVHEAVRFIRRPPLPPILRPTYPLLFAGSVTALPARARRMLRLRRAGPARLAGTRWMLASTAALLGPAAAVGQAHARLAALATAERAPSPAGEH
ncbi:MAG: hypothetical protein QOE37_1098 [Microbacteriaceae bacterium]|nr:hypothetical protein [Microbacteriaceae bacterium]